MKLSPLTFGSPITGVNTKGSDLGAEKEPRFGFRLVLQECEFEINVSERPDSNFRSGNFTETPSIVNPPILSPRN